MDIGSKIKACLKEAELYRGQGLLTESKSGYQTAAKLIQSIDRLKNKAKLLTGIAAKLKSIEAEAARVEGAPDTPEIGEESRALIKKLFSHGKTDDKDARALEEAITLTTFGQHEKAIEEFKALLAKDSVRLVAAKNIIRCFIANDNIDGGIEQFKEWLGSDMMSKDQLNILKRFFQNIIDKKRLDVKVPDTVKTAEDARKPEPEPEAEDSIHVAEEADAEDDILDISSVGIAFESGPKKGEVIELDVSFQTGNVISVLLSGRDKELIESLIPGDKLTDVQFYSPIAIFQGTGVVNAKTEIKVGPRKGDFSVDIKVSSS